MCTKFQLNWSTRFGGCDRLKDRHTSDPIRVSFFDSDERNLKKPK